MFSSRQKAAITITDHSAPSLDNRIENTTTMPNGSNNSSNGEHYNTPGGNNSAGSSYHCECMHEASSDGVHIVAALFSSIVLIMVTLSHSLTTDSHSNGSYYYQNDSGSKYYSAGNGYARYTSPKGNVKETYYGNTINRK